MGVDESGIASATPVSGEERPTLMITVLSVPECPNARLLSERIAVAAVGLPLTMRTIVVPDEPTAAQWGMAGSPTMLIDGTDPFADGSAASISCRLYRDSRGGLCGAPSVVDLERVLREWFARRQ